MKLYRVMPWLLVNAPSLFNAAGTTHRLLEADCLGTNPNTPSSAPLSPVLTLVTAGCFALPRVTFPIFKFAAGVPLPRCAVIDYNGDF
jgi:hypothetical protein